MSVTQVEVLVSVIQSLWHRIALQCIALARMERGIRTLRWCSACVVPLKPSFETWVASKIDYRPPKSIFSPNNPPVFLEGFLDNGTIACKHVCSCLLWWQWIHCHSHKIWFANRWFIENRWSSFRIIFYTVTLLSQRTK